MTARHNSDICGGSPLAPGLDGTFCLRELHEGSGKSAPGKYVLEASKTHLATLRYGKIEKNYIIDNIPGRITSGALDRWTSSMGLTGVTSKGFCPAVCFSTAFDVSQPPESSRKKTPTKIAPERGKAPNPRTGRGESKFDAMECCQKGASSTLTTSDCVMKR